MDNQTSSEVKILIANRGEIARRIVQTCKKMGFTSYVLYTEIDEFSLYVKEADHSILLPSGPLSENFTNQELIISLAKQHNIKAIHPGYGFLSESIEFVKLAEQEGIIWVGPTA